MTENQLVTSVSQTENSKVSSVIAAFFAELMRRRVLQIGGAYIAGAWLGAEILNFLFEQFNAPGWSYSLLAILLVVGFPVSMVLAWIIQVTEDGRWQIDPSRGDYKTLAVAIAIGLIITLGLSWLILPQREPPSVFEPMPVSLAVLPFAELAATPGEITLSGRLHHSLMEGLEQSGGLTLVRLGPGERPGDLTALGRSLDVAGLVSGQLNRSGEGTLIEMQLLDTVTSEISWSQSWEWDVTRVPEIANAIANGLLQVMDLPPLEEPEFTGTGSREAYMALLDGKENAAVLEAGQLSEAVADFQRAINLDPGYAKAYTGLAQALYDLLDTDNLPEPGQHALEQRARAAVKVAQKLDPDSAEAISLLALGLDNRFLRTQAWERALELDPDHFMSFYRYALQMKDEGNLREAERLLKRAIALSPEDARFRLELAAIFSKQGRKEEAQAEWEKAARF
jgi:TolB-like protein